MAKTPKEEKRVLNRKDEKRDKIAAASLMELLGIDAAHPPLFAIQFTSGIHPHFLKHTEVMGTCSMADIAGFKRLRGLGGVEGHQRTIKLCLYKGFPMLALCGRVHLYEGGDQVRQMVRRQTGMLMQLGVKLVISTSAVGSLDPKIPVGSLTLVDGMVRPGNILCSYGAEGFPTLESALDQEVMNADHIREWFQRVTHYHWGSGTIEGKAQKQFLGRLGIQIIGCSGQPEMEVIARYRKAGFDVTGLMVGLVTNGMKHSHGAVLNAAEHYGKGWCGQLMDLVDTFLERYK